MSCPWRHHAHPFSAMPKYDLYKELQRDARRRRRREQKITEEANRLAALRLAEGTSMSSVELSELYDRDVARLQRTVEDSGEDVVLMEKTLPSPVEAVETPTKESGDDNGAAVCPNCHSLLHHDERQGLAPRASVAASAAVVPDTGFTHTTSPPPTSCPRNPMIASPPETLTRVLLPPALLGPPFCSLFGSRRLFP